MNNRLVKKQTLLLPLFMAIASCGSTGVTDKDPSGPATLPKGEIDMSFAASKSGTEPCLYEYWDLGSSSAEVFIEEIQLDVEGDDGPPNSLAINYGSMYSSGQVSLYPPPSDVTLDANESSWSSTIGTGAVRLNGGQEWTIEFSCGTVTICCDDTDYVNVNLFK